MTRISPDDPMDNLPAPEAETAAEPVTYLPTEPVKAIDDLTVPEMLGALVRAPGDTLRALGQVVMETAPTSRPVAAPRIRVSVPRTASERLALSAEERNERNRLAFQLSLRIVAFLAGVYGSIVMATERAEAVGLSIGGLWFLAAAILWLGAEAITAWPDMRARLAKRGEERPDLVEPVAKPERLISAVGWTWRLGFMSAAVAFSVLTLAFTNNNRFTLPGFVCWMVSIALTVSALAPAGWRLSSPRRWLANRQWPERWVLLTLLVIMLAAAGFRLHDLNGNPPEMTSDHVEKILDAQNVRNGITQVFFPNNGGREPTQFYLMALLSYVPGLGLNFFTLRLLTVIESLITIPLLFWMGREMIGDKQPDLRDAVGLALAALVAASYWHEMLSRLGLRITLTVFYTVLLVIYFSRGLRLNNRGDFIKAGLILGFGIYAYQAVRMLPVVVVVGVGIAMMFSLFRPGRWGQIARYAVNLAALVIVSLVVFVPMLGFSLQYPEDFWRRTSGRLLGDDIIQTTDAAGNLVERQATLQERVEAFSENIPVLLGNIRNAVLMYNWKGDVAWVSAVPNRPAMDIYTSAFLILGLAAWLVLMIRRRDPADWLMPAAFFIMMLPSALSIAYPIENPSATRMSGTLPFAYLFAALPLALMAVSLKRLIPTGFGKGVALAAPAVICGLALTANWNTYFVDYRTTYLQSTWAPYTEGGRVLRGFAESGGSYGNAFLLAYPFWWDSRAVGIEAGQPMWDNGIKDPDGDNTGRLPADDVPFTLYRALQRTDQYVYDPERDLLFFLAVADEGNLERLQQLFPAGYTQTIPSYKPGGDFLIYRVPKLGLDGFMDLYNRAQAGQ